MGLWGLPEGPKLFRVGEGVLVPSSSRSRTLCLCLGVGARLVLGAALFLGALLGPAIAYFPFGFFMGFRLSGFFFP